jgi:hypothetical protein
MEFQLQVAWFHMIAGKQDENIIEDIASPATLATKGTVRDPGKGDTITLNKNKVTEAVVEFIF